MYEGVKIVTSLAQVHEMDILDSIREAESLCVMLLQAENRSQAAIIM